MELLFTILLLLSLASGLYICRAWKKRNPGAGKSGRLPPGPRPLPIVGNILELGSQPHRALAKLARVHGPVMLLQLGSLTSVVITSPKAARAVLQHNDQVCSSRAHPETARAMDHHRHSVAWMPVSNQWRKIRKFCKEEMFAVQPLDSSQALRMAKIQDLLDFVRRCAAAGEAVDIGKAAFTTSLNLMSTSLFSVDIAEFGSDSSSEFRDIVNGVMAIIAKPNLTDYFPILRAIDPQGIYRESVGYFRKCFALFDGIIQERMQKRRKDSAAGQAPPYNDMLESILKFNEEDETGLSLDSMRHLLLDLFVAGSDTTSGTVEWAMTELIRHPEKMVKAKQELNEVIGNNQQIQESDIGKLPYLHAIVKETFRLHPVVPLLLPHKANEDVEIDGYVVPKNAQILINTWAIGRDPNVWQDPEKFIPERFLDVQIDYRGRHFELLPFGGGRRICLGIPLAQRMVHLMLATFVANFEWKLEDGVQEVNMDENFGLSLQKAIHLRLVPIASL